LATDEVASACSRIAVRLRSTQLANSRASRAESKTKTGARCIASATTVAITPPDWLSTFMPRL
jgi:hypothetical protein